MIEGGLRAGVDAEETVRSGVFSEHGGFAQGVITAAYGGFYYVQPDQSGHIFECKPRGKLKLSGDRLLVGDRVNVSLEGSVGVIEEVLPRKKILIRPAIANVDQVVLVFALRNPDFNPFLADRFLLLAESNDLDILICLNKSDLVPPRTARQVGERFTKAGYRVLETSAIHNVGQRRLRSLLGGRVSVLAGPSGAGKSALLNMIEPGFKLVSGEVSEKIGRGRHTTRYARLLPLKAGGFVADTPGFTQLDLDFASSGELADLFPEFQPLRSNCRFNGCLHQSEPGCAVREAVESGTVDSLRYQHYLKFLEEIREREKRRFR